MRLIVRRVAVSAAELRAASPTARRRSTIPADQLAMVLDGQLASTYAYSFIVTDIPDNEKSTVQVEHYHRQRAQIEERFKDAKLGQPLRHLPPANLDANRLWLTSCLLALNITAMICDISPAASASDNAPDTTPLHRHANALSQISFCIPAPVTCPAPRTIVHLPEGLRHLHIFHAAYDAAYAPGTP